MENLVPTGFQLSQNYPNPFKERTAIKYCIPEKTRIKLEVFDASRRNVKIIVKQINEAGFYEIEFSGTALPSGVYFYRLQAGDFVQVKKMILLK